MIKFISVWVGIAALCLVTIIGFVNQLNWFTILKRGMSAFFIAYVAMTVLGMIGIQSILQQEIHKRNKHDSDQGQPPKTD